MSAIPLNLYPLCTIEYSTVCEVVSRLVLAVIDTIYYCISATGCAFSASCMFPPTLVSGSLASQTQFLYLGLASKTASAVVVLDHLSVIKAVLMI